MDYQEQLISKRIAEFDGRVDENKATIEEFKMIEFKFPDNYDCYEDETLHAVEALHKRYAEIIKHNIINKGFDVKSMEYIDDYINYADCYISKMIYLLK